MTTTLRPPSGTSEVAIDGVIYEVDSDGNITVPTNFRTELLDAGFTTVLGYSTATLPASPTPGQPYLDTTLDRVKFGNTAGDGYCDTLIAPAGYGAAAGAGVVATESGDSVVKQTLLTLTEFAQTLPNAGQYIGTKIYDFPAGRILILGVTASLAQTTTSVLADTLNASKTGAVSLGTAAASSTTLNSTMADLLPSTAFTSSATIDVAGSAVTAALAASAHFDGTGTAKDLYINTAVVTDGDLDADATIEWDGTILVTWINLGDY